jgi:hypothetical protein
LALWENAFGESESEWHEISRVRGLRRQKRLRSPIAASRNDRDVTIDNERYSVNYNVAWLTEDFNVTS